MFTKIKSWFGKVFPKKSKQLELQMAVEKRAGKRMMREAINSIYNRRACQNLKRTRDLLP